MKVKQKGVVNSCTLAEVPLVYMTLPGKCAHAVPLHRLVGTAKKATWIFLVLTPEDFPFYSISLLRWNRTETHSPKYHVLLVLFQKRAVKERFLIWLKSYANFAGHIINAFSGAFLKDS